MTSVAQILPNYQNRRHLLQNIHLPAKPYGGPGFMYMKNHKAACTNLLTLLLTQMHHALGGADGPEISMDGIHNLAPDYLRAGARGLDWPSVENALTAPDCFRFTIIREPLSRTISAWSDKLQSDTRHRRDLNTYLGRDAGREIALPEFLEILARDEGARRLDRHWRPQHLEISFGQIDYDLIGRVEDMDTARRQIITTLFGVKGHTVQTIDTRDHIGHKSNSHTHRDALSAQDRRNVEQAFAADYDMYARVSETRAA